MESAERPTRGARTSRLIAADGLMAILLTVVSLAFVHLSDSQPNLGFAAVGLTLLQASPLVVRRRWPVAVWGVTLAATAAWTVLGYEDTVATMFAGLVALYSVADQTSRRISFAAAGVTAVGVGSTLLAPSLPVPAIGVVIGFATFGSAWFLGDNLRTRRAYTSLLEEWAERLEQSRAEQARRLVLEERAAIARELHDVVAHHVSLIAVQAETGPYLLRAGPEHVVDGFASIGMTARQALTEMRRLLGVLREETAEPAALTPQSGLDGLDALLAATREAGLPVELAVRGRPRPLPVGVDLSAYRIVQESLTNVRRHAGAQRAWVVMDYATHSLRLRVADDGSGAVGRPAPADGHGLIGMQERVAMLGGDLKAGPGPDGGFVVLATLPVDLEAG